MAKEITGYTNDIKSDINRKNFGFVFSSENAVLKDMNIQNIMVYKARNLLTDGKSYEPIYKTQVTTYIQRVMRLATGDFKQEKLWSFSPASLPAREADGWRRRIASMRLSETETISGIPSTRQRDTARLISHLTVTEESRNRD